MKEIKDCNSFVELREALGYNLTNKRMIESLLKIINLGAKLENKNMGDFDTDMDNWVFMEKMKDKYFPKDIDVLGSFLTYTLTIGRFYVEVEINTAFELASIKVDLLFNSENEEDEKLIKSLPEPTCVKIEYNKDSFKKHKYYYIFKEVSEFKSFINELKEKSV